MRGNILLFLGSSLVPVGGNATTSPQKAALSGKTCHTGRKAYVWDPGNVTGWWVYSSEGVLVFVFKFMEALL